MSRRARAALALVPALAAITVGGVVSARAQSPPVSVQESPPTTDLLSALLQKLLPPPTTVTSVPAPATASTPSAPVPDSGPSGPSSGSSPAPPPPEDRTIPPEAIPIINSVVRSGTNNSNALLAALRPLTDHGLSAEEAALIGFGQFPVAGEAWWSDDFYNPRFTPEFHLHQGNDIFAARGTPVRAPVAGRIEYMNGGAAGLGFFLTAGDGTYYFGCHLDSFAKDVSSGSYVKQGQVIGFVGDTGNAVGGAPHLHFEIHPRGGPAINPKDTLDLWVKQALDNVPKLLADWLGQYEVSIPRSLTAAGSFRRLAAGSLGGPTTADGPRLWMSSVRRDGGGLRLSPGTSGGVDPGQAAVRARDAEALAIDRVRAEQLSNDVLTPLTPKVLAGILAGASGGRGSDGGG